MDHIYLFTNRDIAYGMEHLAQRHITHRDLKSTNVLLDDNLGCKVPQYIEPYQAGVSDSHELSCALQIADFGLSKTQNTIMSTMGNTGFRGTFEFAVCEEASMYKLCKVGPDSVHCSSQAPEVLNGEPCTEKGDAYAYGVLTWETLSRRRPW